MVGVESGLAKEEVARRDGGESTRKRKWEPEPDSEVADCDADNPAPESEWGWEACTVVDRNADGTIDVRIADDGALCRGVQARFVRALGREALVR